MLIEEIAKLQSVDVNQFIDTVYHLDPQKIILKYHSKSSLPIKAIAEQIECRKKASEKFKNLPYKRLIYTKQAFEQSSSETTAKFKSELLRGKNFIDLTGGLGIDFYFISKNFNENIFCEENSVLAEIFKHNSKTLECENLISRNENSLDVLAEYNDKYFDWIYVDPSRRSSGRRSVDLKYCNPNLNEHLELISKKGKNILIKLSPAFDFKEAQKIFDRMTNFYVVSSDGECKEVLIIIDTRKKPKSVNVHSVIISCDKTRIFSKNNVEEIEKHFSDIIHSNYLYIPDCSITASGLTDKLANRYRLNWVSFNTTLLHGNELHNDFPGRIFLIKNVDIYNQKRFIGEIKLRNIFSANIICKNFTVKPEEMYKNLKIKTGGNFYFIFTRNNKGKLIYLIAEKIN